MGMMIPQEYVKARSVLLDALDGLGAHREAVVLVGAQAVHLHSGDADFVTAPTTTDADLALIPERLADSPAIAEAMRAAGFTAGGQPGSWLRRGGVAVDLMTPEVLSGPGGRRSARLEPPHDDRSTARRTAGLEPAVVDNGIHRISSLEIGDERSFDIKVAGAAALVVSKVIKIGERRDQPGRLKPKDGLDILRLLRAVETTPLAQDLRKPSSAVLSGETTDTAVRTLRELATGPDDLLPSLAADAEAGFGDTEVIRMSMVALVDDLIREFDAVPVN